MDRVKKYINYENLKHNLESIDSYLDGYCQIIGVVKGDAYGHGAVSIARYLQDNLNLGYLAVATLGEALELRKNEIRTEILILGHTSPEYYCEILKYNLTQTVISEEHARTIIEFASEQSQLIKVQIAIDTGMHRIGLSPDSIDLLISLYQNPNIKVTGIFSHLCDSDVENQESQDFSREQISKFEILLEKLKKRGIKELGIRHMAASYGAINYPMAHFDAVRIGILMYGVTSSYSNYFRKKIDLKPVMSIKTKIVSIRTIDKGDTVGYGRMFKAERKTVVATVPVGFADGFPRSLSNGKMRAILNDEYISAIGRICMDQMMFDVTDVPSAKVGDEIILLGDNLHGKAILAEELAMNSDTTTNEFLSRLGRRFE